MRVLVSVQSEAECKQVLDAGVSMIDFKDAKAGALGMLDLALTRQLCQQVAAASRQANHISSDSDIMLSATLGDTCPSVQYLEQAILGRMDIGIKVIKLPITLCMVTEYQLVIRRLIARGLKLIAVFSPRQFAAPEQWSRFIPYCVNEGYFGVMLDTMQKSSSLISQLTPVQLQSFIRVARKHSMFVGLAGGLTADDVTALTELQPDYLGFRGGVCEQSQRTSALSASRLQALMQKCRIHA